MPATLPSCSASSNQKTQPMTTKPGLPVQALLYPGTSHFSFIHSPTGRSVPAGSLILLEDVTFDTQGCFPMMWGRISWLPTEHFVEPHPQSQWLDFWPFDGSTDEGYWTPLVPRNARPGDSPRRVNGGKYVLLNGPQMRVFYPEFC